jgi:WD40 repeat protein
MGLQRLAKPWYRARALRLFRDESALSANPHLWSSIETALDESDWFVLLASPDAVASEWVNRELDHWLAVKPLDRILIAVTDGTWLWDKHAQGLAGTAVPAGLGGAFTDEPRHVDLRWARTRTDLDMHNPRFRDTVAQLAAPMHGKAKDDLESEDVRQHRHTRRLARGSASLLALLLAVSVAFATFAVQQREQAQHNAKRAEQQTEIARRETKNARADSERAHRALNVAVATNLVVASADALRNGRTDLGLLLAIQAERLDPTPVTRTALLSAVVDQPSLQLNLHGLASAYSAAFSADGRLLAGSSLSGQLGIWDLHSGQPLRPPSPRLSNFAGLVGFADNGRTLVATTSQQTTSGSVLTAKVLDVATGRSVKSITFPTGGPVATATMAPELIWANGPGGAEFMNTRTGKLIRTFSSSAEFWALSADGSIAASYSAASADQVQAWSTQTGLREGPGCVHSPAVTDTAIPSSEINVSVAADSRAVRITAPTGPGFASGVVLTCDIPSGSSTVTVLSTRQQGRSFAGVSPDNRYVVTRDTLGDGSLLINDPTTGAQVGPVLHAPSDPYYMQGFAPVVFSPDGGLMTAPENDGTIRVWNTRTFLPPIATESTNASLQSLGKFGHTGVIDSKVLGRFSDVLDAAVSDDGRFVAIMTKTALIEFDAKRAVTQSLSLQQLGCPQFDPLGLWASLRGLGVGAGSAAIVVGCTSISPTTGKGGSLIYIDISKPHWSIAPPIETSVYTDNLLFSPDGQWLVAQSAAASDEGVLQVFRVRSDHLTAGARLEGINGRPLVTPNSDGFVVHHNGRTSRWRFADATLTDLQLAKPGDPVGLSGDGRYLATADSNQPNGITLWDLQTKSSVGTLPLGTNGDTTVTFGATGRSVVVGQQTRTTWNLEPDSWIRDACAVADRNLTSDEWATYLPGVPKQATCVSG